MPSSMWNLTRPSLDYDKSSRKNRRKRKNDQNDQNRDLYKKTKMKSFKMINLRISKIWNDLRLNKTVHHSSLRLDKVESSLPQLERLVTGLHFELLVSRGQDLSEGLLEVSCPCMIRQIHAYQNERTGVNPVSKSRSNCYKHVLYRADGAYL